ncbi:Pollen Ole e 1 allergen/extensin [Cynara cardunculus var. scolymus]|uniref:Pollen Ole e 1 allergen/extensin n=2 Tax=Cynara cardunculus var. scolymus TaxID=59895 RepID=A0A118K093_CYNCS|nr:Pollen Ole e 1 allergen/extensin [Cynara cardunculus var. scolymus]
MAVSCDTSRKTSKSDWVRGITDEYGDFVIDLPSHLHALPNMEKRCRLKILQLPNASPCHQAFTGEYRGIKFSSAKNGIRTYTAHEIHLTPKNPQACMNEKGRGKMLVHTF